MMIREESVAGASITNRPEYNKKLQNSILAGVRRSEPTGDWLRYDGTYEAIAEARREEDPSLPQGVWVHDLKEADWRAVERLCISALTDKSKDLNLLAWLIEAWFHLDGLAGLARGADLMRMVCAKYWQSLYPHNTAEDGERDDRLVVIDWLNEKLSELIDLVSVTAPLDEEFNIYTLGEYNYLQQKSPESALTTKKQKAKATAYDEKLKKIKLVQSAANTPKKFFNKTSKQAVDCLKEVEKLEQELEKLVDQGSLSLYRIRQKMQNIQQACDVLAKERVEQSSDKVVVPEKKSAANKKPTKIDDVANIHIVGKITSIDDAVDQLENAAEFIAANYPNNLAPYMIRKAVSWSGKNITEVLDDISKLGIDIRQLQEWLDMKG